MFRTRQVQVPTSKSTTSATTYSQGQPTVPWSLFPLILPNCYTTSTDE